MDYTYIVCKNHPQIYLEKCKYKTKKYKLPNLHSDSDSESSDSDSDSGLGNLCFSYSVFS